MFNDCESIDLCSDAVVSPSADPIVRCFVCGVWQFRSVMLDGSDGGDSSCVSGTNCDAYGRLCHYSCRRYGITECQKCNPDDYRKNIDRALYQIFGNVDDDNDDTPAASLV